MRAKGLNFSSPKRQRSVSSFRISGSAFGSYIVLQLGGGAGRPTDTAQAGRQADQVRQAAAEGTRHGEARRESGVS